MNILFKKLLSLNISKNIFLSFFGKKGKPVYIGLVFHAEKIYDKTVFDKLVDLGKFLSFKATLCITTPKNPYIKSEMEKINLNESEFTERIKTLSNFYEIGFHGHWCRKSDNFKFYDKKIITEIEKSGFVLTLNDSEEIKKQFKEEFEYLDKNIYRPKIYTAGWWYLNDTIIKLLDDYGFEFDCSVRYKYPDTFGERYIQNDKLPSQGYPFYISTSKKTMELNSISYLHMNWWTILKDLYSILKQKNGPSFIIIPIHDYNLLDNYEKIKENITFISKINNVKWIEVSNMKNIISESTLRGVKL